MDSELCSRLFGLRKFFLYLAVSSMQVQMLARNVGHDSSPRGFVFHADHMKLITCNNRHIGFDLG